MDDDQIKAIIKRALANSVGGDLGEFTTEHSEPLIEQREAAIRAFYGEPIGNEVPHRSQAIMLDVADTIYWSLPAQMEFLTSGPKICRFTAAAPEFVDQIEDAEDLVHHIMFVQNPGYFRVLDFVHDALLEKLGIFKIVVDKTPVKTRKTARGLNPDQVALIKEGGDEDEFEFIEAVEDDDMMEETGQEDLWKVSYYKTTNKAKILVRTLPPETFGWTKGSDELDESYLLYHAEHVTRSDLLKRGYKRSKVDELGRSEGKIKGRIKRARAQSDQELGDGVNTFDRSQDRILVIECYLQIDVDGDGISEYRKITVAGNQLEVLDNEELEDPLDHPFAAGSPFRNPHKVCGQSLADRTFDVQIIHSTIVRQGLDALYNANINRTIFDPEAIDPDSWLDNSMSGQIPMRPSSSHQRSPQDAVFQLANVPVDVQPMLEHIQGVKRDRTGVDPFNTDSTAEALKNSGSGIALGIMQSSTRKLQELIGRNMAHAVAMACKKILKAAISHGIVVQVPRGKDPMTGQPAFVTIDPSDWSPDMISEVQIGLGFGSPEREMAALSDLQDQQQGLVSLQGGIKGDLIQPKHLINSVKRFIEIAELGDHTQYIGPPDEPQEPEPPDPAAELANVELQIKNVDLEIANAKLMEAQQRPELERQKAAAKWEAETRSADVDEKRAEIETQQSTQKHEADMAKAQADLQDGEDKAQIEREKIAQKESADRRKFALEQQKLALEQRKLALQQMQMQFQQRAEEKRLVLERSDAIRAGSQEGKRIDLERQKVKAMATRPKPKPKGGPRR